MESSKVVRPHSLKVNELKDELAKRNLATTGKKNELIDRLVQDIVKDLSTEKLKEALKLHSLPLTGTKEELLNRLKEHLQGPSSSNSSDQPVAMLAEEEKKEGLKFGDIPFELTESFDPNKLTFVELKAVAKKLGLSQAGRKTDILTRVINDALDNANLKQLQAVLKFNHQPSSGTKVELKASITKLWNTEKTESNVDINNAPAKDLLILTNNDETLANAIVSNRPYSDIGDLNKKVTGLSADTLKTNLHLLTGWIPVSIKPTTTPTKGKANTIVEPEVTTINNKSTPNEIIAKNEQDAKQRLAKKQIKIASWNIRNISKKKSDTNLTLILQLVTCFDFIAIQEVRDTEVIGRMITMLGSGWTSSVSGLVGTEHHKEHYGFLWRKEFITVLTAPELLVDQRDDFVREPYIGYFSAGKFDFILATIHVVWGDSIFGRREEIKKLDDLLNSIKLRAKTEKDIIIVGDFNMPPVDMSWGIDGWKPLMNPPQKTVVGDTSLYDNIWISEKDTLNSEFTGQFGCIEFDKILYEDSISGRRKAMSEMSDHRPIWGLFSTAKDDDENVELSLKNLTI